VLAGLEGTTMAVVDADHFVTDDPAFVAVTDATMNRVASAVTNV
jgi:hypothetical protein